MILRGGKRVVIACAVTDRELERSEAIMRVRQIASSIIEVPISSDR